MPQLALTNRWSDAYKVAHTMNMYYSCTAGSDCITNVHGLSLRSGRNLHTACMLLKFMYANIVICSYLVISTILCKMSRKNNQVTLNTFPTTLHVRHKIVSFSTYSFLTSEIYANGENA